MDANYKEIEWDGHKLIQLLKTLTLEQCYEYLMSGFVRKHITVHKYDIYPIVLQILSIKYVGDAFFFRFKSSLIATSEVELMNENYARIKNNAISNSLDGMVNTTLLIDIPIPIDNSSLHLKWNVKINGSSFPNMHYFIGIVPNTFNEFDTSVWNLYTRNRNATIFDDIYGAFCWDLDWFGENFSSELDIVARRVNGASSKTGTSYEGDGIVGVEFNAKLKQLTITKLETKELIYLINLNTPTTNDIKYWYPAISIRNKNDSVLL